MTCFLREKLADENEEVYKILEKAVEVTKIKRLVVDTISYNAKCSCKEMEFTGIPCRHILTYLRMKQIELLPQPYKLKMWLQTAESSIVLVGEGKDVDTLIVSKRALFLRKASDLIDKALMSKERSHGQSWTLWLLVTMVERKKSEYGGRSSQMRWLNIMFKLKEKGCRKQVKKRNKSIREMCRGQAKFSIAKYKLRKRK